MVGGIVPGRGEPRLPQPPVVPGRVRECHFHSATVLEVQPREPVAQGLVAKGLGPRSPRSEPGATEARSGVSPGHAVRQHRLPLGSRGPYSIERRPAHPIDYADYRLPSFGIAEVQILTQGEGETVGIDMGLTVLTTPSDGDPIANPKALAAAPGRTAFAGQGDRAVAQGAWQESIIQATGSPVPDRILRAGFLVWHVALRPCLDRDGGIAGSHRVREQEFAGPRAPNRRFRALHRGFADSRRVSRGFCRRSCIVGGPCRRSDWSWP